MIVDEIKYQISRYLDFSLTSQQDKALSVFSDFYINGNDRSVMIIRGSAGTGKTSLASAIVTMLSKSGKKVMLLAPTGRAAKVFSVNSSHTAFTIHRVIYRQKKFDSSGGQFNINYNHYPGTLFVVDEASMIANEGVSGSTFGSGNLLDDLVSFVYGGNGCRLMLIGDICQLPPVGENFSPALNRRVMLGYQLNVFESTLTDVVRQVYGSGILTNATMIRQLLEKQTGMVMPKVLLKGFADICMTSGENLLEQLANSYSNVGADETMVITRSNKRANIFNFGVRSRVLGFEDELSSGDIVMIVKNNYYWSEKKKCGLDFIANGDRAIVRKVRHLVELYGFHFADVTLRFPDYDDVEFEATVILDTLTSEAPALTVEQNETLFNNVCLDYSEITRKEDRIKLMRENKYFNALQIKYAYAVTCHKAQGGQWSDVYVDQGFLTVDMLNIDYLRWLYTAFTRATEHLYLVNWPDAMVE
jgi:hypothetical protein